MFTVCPWGSLLLFRLCIPMANIGLSLLRLFLGVNICVKSCSNLLTHIEVKSNWADHWHRQNILLVVLEGQLNRKTGLWGCLLALSGNIFINTKSAFLSHPKTIKTDGPVFWFHYQACDLTPNTTSGSVSWFLLVSTNLPFLLKQNLQPVSVASRTELATLGGFAACRSGTLCTCSMLFLKISKCCQNLLIMSYSSDCSCQRRKQRQSEKSNSLKSNELWNGSLGDLPSCWYRLS